jgi:hypothetical protein
MTILKLDRLYFFAFTFFRRQRCQRSDRALLFRHFHPRAGFVVFAIDAISNGPARHGGIADDLYPGTLDKASIEA